MNRSRRPRSAPTTVAYAADGVGAWHDTRHTAGTMSIEQGVNIRVVQEVLGHTRVTTTQRYTHVAAA
jgi:site-specific recombinase XerD